LQFQVVGAFSVNDSSEVSKLSIHTPNYTWSLE
jgi:hypothetical protein